LTHVIFGDNCVSIKSKVTTSGLILMEFNTINN